MHEAFEVHMLNEDGKRRAGQIAKAFNDCWVKVEAECLGGRPRERALVLTKLEESCFFAKKAMASNPANQMPERGEAPF